MGRAAMASEKRPTPIREPRLPCNPQAERNVLGCALESPDAMDIAAGMLRADDFYIAAHSTIFAAMIGLREAGTVVDLVTVCEALKREGRLRDVGGQADVSALTTDIGSSFHIAHYAEIVLRAAHQRRLADLWQRHALLGYDETAEPTASIGAIQDALATLSERVFAQQGRTAIVSARDLRNRDLPEPHLIAAGIIPEGLTILGGRPKMGKSWLALNLALSVAGGWPALGYTSTEQGDVLYLALEDTWGRLQRRLQQCTPDGADLPDALDFAVNCPRLDAGGLVFIESWMRRKATPRLIVVDTLAMIRANSDGTREGNQYAQDYAALSSLKKLADAHHAAIVVVHHLRKSGSASDDPLEELSGTNAISGAADNILVLKRARGENDGTLHVAGRDIEEQEYAVRFDPSGGWWNITGSGAEMRLNAGQQLVVDAIKDAGCAVAPHEIAQLTGLNRNTVKSLVWRMAKNGLLVANEGGKYSLTTM